MHIIVPAQQTFFTSINPWLTKLWQLKSLERGRQEAVHQCRSDQYTKVYGYPYEKPHLKGYGL